MSQMSSDLPRRIIEREARSAHERAVAVELGYTDTGAITEPQRVNSAISLPVQYAEDRAMLADVVDNLFETLADYIATHPGVRSSWYLPDESGQPPAVLELSLTVSPRYAGSYAGGGPEVAQTSISVVLESPDRLAAPGASTGVESA